MKVLVTTPFTPISKNVSSHRSAQGVIYADQLKNVGFDVHLNMTGNIDTDYNAYDAIYVYHGNDWFGTLNMFGGVQNYANIDSVINMSKFKGAVYSIDIDFPYYHEMLMNRFKSASSKHADWDLVDWDNYKKICETARTIRLNDKVKSLNIVTGDSHSICMYRPGWRVNSVPFKTLHGALKTGLSDFLIPPNRDPENIDLFENIEFYFGNIDIRHHILRQSDPEGAVKELVREYTKQALEIAEDHNAKVRIYELLPIENESRVLPKTGYYKGTPFYGSWADRNKMRLMFKEELKKYEHECLEIVEWTDYLLNEKGELDFEYMEKPKSVHLSREYYPHWQGLEWNRNYNTLLEYFV
jgi:hypothetical protein